MTRRLTGVAGYYHAALLAALPWVVWWRPSWTPVLVVLAVGVWTTADRGRDLVDPAAAGVIAVSAVASLLFTAGPAAAGGWLGAAAIVTTTAVLVGGRRRPDPADVVGAGFWAVAFLVLPELLETAGGGWAAPAVLLVAARRIGRNLAPHGEVDRERRFPAPPRREVRGTLSLRGVVVAGSDGLPRTVPLDVEVRAGESVAIRCDAAVDAEALAATLDGSRAPAAGEVAVDGIPLERPSGVVARIGRGEPFVTGTLEANLGALCEQPPSRQELAAVREAVGLSEVEAALDGRSLDAEGEPLTELHRLLVQVARVMPSHYRVVVVVDPQPWVNAVRAELWRSALVRAAVGRTSIWITADPELAARASWVMELRSGGLRTRSQPERDEET